MKNVSSIHTFMEKHLVASIVGVIGLCLGGYAGISYATNSSSLISDSARGYMLIVDSGSGGMDLEGKKIYYSGMRDIFQGVVNTITDRINTLNSTPTTPGTGTPGTGTPGTGTPGTGTPGTGTPGTGTPGTGTPGTGTPGTGTPAPDYSFSPRCGDQYDSSGDATAINLGSFGGSVGGKSFSSNDFSPTSVCKFPLGSIPRFSTNMGIDFVDASIDIKGTSGTFKWRCYGADREGKPDTGNTVDCKARKVIDAECGPYTGTEREKFDELEEGIGGPLPQSVKDNYCKVGWAVQGIDTRAQNEKDLSQFSWICRSKDNYAKFCKAKIKPYKIGLGACVVTTSDNLRLLANGNYDGNTLGSSMNMLGVGHEYAKCVAGCDTARSYNLNNVTSPLYCYYEGMLAKDYSLNKVYDLRGKASPVTGGATTTTPTTPGTGTTPTTPGTGTTPTTPGTGTTPTTPGTGTTPTTPGTGTTPTAPKMCPGGKTNVLSPDTNNTCYFEWSETPAGSSAIAPKPSGGGMLNGTCGSDGAWKNWNLNCPNTSTVKTCTSGGRTFSSADGSNNCTVSYIQANVGQSISVGNGVYDTEKKGVAGSASCVAQDKWTFDVRCPNLAGQSCSTGYIQIQSDDKSVTCEGAYPGKNAGQTATARLSNDGSISATCGADGNWQGVSGVCPRKP